MKPSKVIVSTDKEYSDKFEYLLAELFDRRVELFCACGAHCGQWELAMDLYATDPARSDQYHHITTTSHIDEPFDDVLNMAEMWVIENGSNEVEVIKL